MYLPLWGLAIILLLCLTAIWTAVSAFFTLAVQDVRGTISFWIALGVLALIIFLASWLGYEAILFNSRQE